MSKTNAKAHKAHRTVQEDAPRKKGSSAKGTGGSTRKATRKEKQSDHANADRSISKKSFRPGLTGRVEFIDPQSIKDSPNPLNWRKHPQRQRQAYNALKSEVGWLDFIIFNEITGHLIDGHMRLDEAIKNKEPGVWVAYGRWTEEQEKLALAKKDPLASLAQTNAEALSSLTTSVQKNINKLSKNIKDTLTKFNTDLSSHARAVEAGEAPSVLLERVRSKPTEEQPDDSPDEEIEDSGSIVETRFRDDVLFPSDNPWGIPPLRSDMLCDTVPDHTWDRSGDEHASAFFCYSAGPATFPSAEDRQGGVLGFFTEDFRFEVAWNDSPAFTQRLLDQDWAGVCLPDFSQWGDWPYPIRLHNLYRSRWCGRYWQEAGIRVIPILQAMGDAEQFSDLVFGSLPTKPPVVAVQCRTGNQAGYWENYCGFLKLALAIVKPETVVIYGGSEHKKYLHGHLPSRKGTRYAFLESFIARRRSKR